jgi:general secretion pathway protein B
MSFILDALRKSENERQRSSVPRVTRAPLARPRARPPVWTVVVIAVLTCSVIVLGAAWWITFSSRPAAAPAVTAQAESPSSAPASAADRAAATAAAAAESRATDPIPVPASAAVPPRTSPLDSLAVSAAPVTPSVTSPPPSSQPAAADTGSADASQATSTRAPTRAELIADGLSIPDVRLELHAYDPSADRRFAFINGQRVVEGEALREGPRVVSIDTDSVTLSYGGTRFRITAQ